MAMAERLLAFPFNKDPITQLLPDKAIKYSGKREKNGQPSLGPCSKTTLSDLPSGAQMRAVNLTHPEHIHMGPRHTSTKELAKAIDPKAEKPKCELIAMDANSLPSGGCLCRPYYISALESARLC